MTRGTKQSQNNTTWSTFGALFRTCKQNKTGSKTVTETLRVNTLVDGDGTCKHTFSPSSLVLWGGGHRSSFLWGSSTSPSCLVLLKGGQVTYWERGMVVTHWGEGRRAPTWGRVGHPPKGHLSGGKGGSGGSR